MLRETLRRAMRISRRLDELINMPKPTELYKRNMEAILKDYPRGSHDRLRAEAAQRNLNAIARRREDRMIRSVAYATSPGAVYALRQLNQVFITAYDAPFTKPENEYIN
jgi:predicted nuclease with RNAse H fold